MIFLEHTGISPWEVEINGNRFPRAKVLILDEMETIVREFLSGVGPMPKMIESHQYSSSISATVVMEGGLKWYDVFRIMSGNVAIWDGKITGIEEMPDKKHYTVTATGMWIV